MSDPGYIPIAWPNVGDAELDRLREVLDSGWLTQGAQVAAFEKAFAGRHRTGHAIAVSSGTAGLHLALAALGIGPGDEVIVPAFTWVSTANAVVYCGATPVFADIDPASYNLDAAALESRLTPRTRAVVPVHLFGLCVDMDALRAVLPDGVFVVEDAACAVGAEWKGVPAGGLGDAGVFSFHPRKVLTTGEGGMVTTDDAALAGKVRVLRNHGAAIPEEERHQGTEPHRLPDFDVLGFNYRMTDLQGAVGRAQLDRLDAMIDDRARWAGYYRDHLGDLDWLRLPAEPEHGRHGWQAFVASVDPARAPVPRNEIMETLQAQGIATRPGTHAVPGLGYYRERLGFSVSSYPVAQACEMQTLALPLHNCMADEDYARVVACLRDL